MPNVKFMKAGVILVVGAFLWGCASSQDVRILDREVTQLQSQVNVLQKDHQREKEAHSSEMAALKLPAEGN